MAVLGPQLAPKLDLLPPPYTPPSPPAADVLTIENSRSDNAMLRALAAGGYGRDLGPGVYDVHSPQVPPVEFIVSRIRWVAVGAAGGT